MRLEPRLSWVGSLLESGKETGIRAVLASSCRLVATASKPEALTTRSKDVLAPQVGLGSEYGIDSIGSYWFYCNINSCTRMPICTTDLSHATDFRELYVAGWRG
jgi:hypothetical protein